jgi:hypothetical protein
MSESYELEYLCNAGYGKRAENPLDMLYKK